MIELLSILSPLGAAGTVIAVVWVLLKRAQNDIAGLRDDVNSLKDSVGTHVVSIEHRLTRVETKVNGTYVGHAR